MPALPGNLHGPRGAVMEDDPMTSLEKYRARHMVEVAERAVQFIVGRQRPDLDEDRMLLFTLVHTIEVLDEAASKISEETRATHTGIPWRAIIGMRNRLIHAYFEVNTEIVWQTVTQEIPALLPQWRALATAE
jgi:uncharacterized protein with HEPN domain